MRAPVNKEPGGLEGGCLCGAIRYRLEAAPFDAGYCHCQAPAATERR